MCVLPCVCLVQTVQFHCNTSWTWGALWRGPRIPPRSPECPSSCTAPSQPPRSGRWTRSGTSEGSLIRSDISSVSCTPGLSAATGGCLEKWSRRSERRSSSPGWRCQRPMSWSRHRNDVLYRRWSRQIKVGLKMNVSWPVWDWDSPLRWCFLEPCQNVRI